jgi:hypothetical protein
MFCDVTDMPVADESASLNAALLEMSRVGMGIVNSVDA